MRNFTREGAAVASGHTQGSSYPYPRAQAVCRGAGATGRCGARLLRTAGYRGTPRAGRLPGGGRRIPGAARAIRRGLRPGRYGAHVGRGYPGRAYTGRRGYRAKQAAFRGARRRLPGRGLSGRLPRRRRLPVPGRLPGGAIPGAGYPAGRRGGTPSPGGATPGGLPGHSW